MSKQLSEECIKAIKDNCFYPDRLIFQSGAKEALTNPEIYTKADLISLEDSLGFAEWVMDNAIMHAQIDNTWDYNKKWITTQELYTLYINQKKVK